MTRSKFLNAILPRIPVTIARDIEKKLQDYGKLGSSKNERGQKHQSRRDTSNFRNIAQSLSKDAPGHRFVRNEFGERILVPTKPRARSRSPVAIRPVEHKKDIQASHSVEDEESGDESDSKYKLSSDDEN